MLGNSDTFEQKKIQKNITKEKLIIRGLKKLFDFQVKNQKKIS